MILCLRPEPDSSEDVTELTRLDIEALPLPMLTISYTGGQDEQLCRPDIADVYQGLVITSKQASRFLSAQTETRPQLARLPVWCVGRGSAEILRQSGYQLAYTGSGTARDLATAISQQALAEDGPFLWLSGRDIHVDIGACLADTQISVDRLVIYQADAATPDREAVYDYLTSGGPVAAVVFSARTLMRFDSWLDEQAPLANKEQITILAASPALAEQARQAGFAVRQAARPDRQTVLQLCQDWSDQQINKTLS